MLALPVSFTRSALSTSTYRVPGVARNSLFRSFYILKLKPQKRPRVLFGLLVCDSSCVWNGKGVSRFSQGKGCHPDCRLWFSNRRDSCRTCTVHARASAVLAHEKRSASKVSVDTNATRIGPSVPKPGTDDQQREQSTVDASLQVAEADDDEQYVGEGEKLRRQRIGLANKGRVPWNKGRQHSPETIERIRQSTYQAMHSPKVKAKLKLNPRHPQSDATRLKIRDKLREQWDLKKKIRGYQEACLKEWKEYIAEAARVGAPGDVEYEWTSYSVIKRRLRDQERTARLSQSRAPKSRPSKSDEHRQKISAAIRAKWEDPEYQQKVRNGMTKMVKVSAPEKKLPTLGTGVFEKKTSSEIAMDQSFIDAVMSDERTNRMLRVEAQELEEERVSPPVPTVKSSIKPMKKVDLLQKVAQKVELQQKVIVQKIKPVERTKATKGSVTSKSSSLPSVDSEANEKLQKLKLLHANRAIMEQRRRESANHARLLMAEAEKATRALEATGTKDEFAMASLTETRRLMAEAARFIQTAESRMSRLTSSDESQ